MAGMKRFALIGLAAVVTLGLAARAEALALTIGDSRYVGLIDPDHPASPAAENAAIDSLATMAPSTSTVVGPNTLTRSGNTCLSLTGSATCPSAGIQQGGTGTSTSYVLVAYTGYLAAKYDGPNFGAAVWFLNNVTDTVTIPSGAGSQNYGLSGVNLFTTTTAPDDVTPDSNPGDVVPEPASLLLLGTGLGAVAMRARRKATQKA